MTRTAPLLAAALAFSGCALVGTLPDPPALGASACNEYRAQVRYTRDLEEVYRTRSSWNRGALYVAGGIVIAGLSAATAGAGAGVALGTLALLGIATGATAGIVGMVDNVTLADIYTMSANELTLLSAQTETLLLIDPATGNRYMDQMACAKALMFLRLGVARVRTVLETARTDGATAAVIRAKAQQQRIDRALNGSREE